jgi:hypothetical protein
MSLILSGTDGVSDIDGSAATPAIRGTDTNTGIFFPAADTIAFAEGGAESARFDSAGNLGIGTSSPSGKLDVASSGNTVSVLRATSSGSPMFYLAGAGGGTPSIAFNSSQGLRFAKSDDAAFTNYAELMRIDSSGNLLVGNTSKLSGGIGGIDINRSSGAGLTLGTSGTSRAFFYVNSGNTTCQWETVSGLTAAVVSGGSGGVSLANGATSWAAISDERLKTSVTPFQGALQKVGTLRAGTGRYLSDDESVSRSFLVAQDVQAVLPEAVDVAADEQGTLSLRYTDTIPLLVAAIQEQQALIQTLTARVAALEGAQP